LAREKDLIGELLDALPPCDHYGQSWHHRVTNWLPAYWRGYSQTTRYTYRLQSLDDLDSVWEGMQSNIRSDIRKAQERVGVRIEGDASFDDFLRLNDLTFERQRKAAPYGRDFLHRLDGAAAAQHARRVFIARDAAGRAHAGAYLVWDAEAAYYLMGGGDPEVRNSGATSLCMWEAIKFASTVTKSFDFEGSMIEPVERFFRAFGAIQTPYFAISRLTSWQLRARRAIRELLPRKGER
jgi:lipid II:glycine glycyltransferase (peptidoglycan interpeptide bridge formation enzyme)